MKSNPYRSHTFAAAAAAALVTTVLAGAIVEGFNTAKLERAIAGPGADTVVALVRRDGGQAPAWT